MVDKLDVEDSGKPHPYHMVEPSPWPFLGSFAGGLLAVGAVLWFHEVKIYGVEVGLKGVYLGLAALLAVMIFWWRDVIRESVTEKAHTAIAEIGMRYGMALFIASEVMFFVAFFWAFFDASLFANEAAQIARLDYTDGQWPPPQINTIKPFDLPFMMTLILLLSGCTVTWAHHAVLENNKHDLTQALGLSVLLGVAFLGFQAYEYSHALHAFGFGEGIYASTFYMATGFHGFHVFIGTVFLFVCYLRARVGHFTDERHFGFEAAAWYWHFVDVVWLFLFVAIYWWGNTIGIGNGG